MFNILAKVFDAGGVLPGTAVLEVHPGQLSRWLDELWGAGPAKVPVPPAPDAPPFLGDIDVVKTLDPPPAGAPFFVGASGINPANAADFSGGVTPLTVSPIWHHLIYAYLLENTGMVEIFAEVIRRAAFGETLEIQGAKALQWLRATEELFFRDPPLFSIAGVTSQLRPESRVVRRNAYWRMFGMDLSHPLTRGASGQPSPWKQHTGGGVNSTFREKWCELLRQVWLGIENRTNFAGAKATDDAYLQLLCESLRDMMNMRRRGGFLAREEFASVAVMSWFDLTLSADTPIIQALNANATSPADRLALVGQQVGITPAPRSRELFELAEKMSALLRVMEAGGFNSLPQAATLYIPGDVSTTMNQIIDLWQSATGERVKDRPIGNVVVPAPAPAQPLRIPDTQPLGAPRLVARTGTGGRS